MKASICKILAEEGFIEGWEQFEATNHKGNKFKMSGKFWAGGGIGFCDPEDWNSPADVLDDDFCTACAAWGRITGTYPPSDLDLKFSGPSVECAL